MEYLAHVCQCPLHGTQISALNTNCWRCLVVIFALPFCLQPAHVLWQLPFALFQIQWEARQEAPATVTRTESTNPKMCLCKCWAVVHLEQFAELSELSTNFVKVLFESTGELAKCCHWIPECHQFTRSIMWQQVGSYELNFDAQARNKAYQLKHTESRIFIFFSFWGQHCQCFLRFPCVSTCSLFFYV